MKQSQRTVLYEQHIKHGATMVEFGGWDMPIQYPKGILYEHLVTRKQAGLFDVSHMGRFVIRGQKAVAFLQYVLTNDAADLQVGQSQYTIIPNERGGAIDDAYLYRFEADNYLLVVNASNREKDWEHLQMHLKKFPGVDLVDQTRTLSMISLQGPRSQDMVTRSLSSGVLPDPRRNALSVVHMQDATVWLARTGYTGEPFCFELIAVSEQAEMIWDLLITQGAEPVGLGARDTLRLEAGLPLYGHELGCDPEGHEIPVLAMSLSRFAVKFPPSKGDFIGKQVLFEQAEARKKILAGDFSGTGILPKLIRPVALVDKGIARAGDKVFAESWHVGYITSGTMVPYWKYEDTGTTIQLTDETGKRAIGLALLDSRLGQDDDVEIEIRKRKIHAKIVPYHLLSKTPPYARAVVYA